MTEPRILEFPSLRLSPIAVTEHPGFGRDRIRAKVGPYEVWMDEDQTVHVADVRIGDSAERKAAERTLSLIEAFTFGGGLIVDNPDVFCPAEKMSEPERAAAIWAGAYLLIEGARYMRVEGPGPGSA